MAGVNVFCPCCNKVSRIVRELREGVQPNTYFVVLLRMPPHPDPFDGAAKEKLADEPQGMRNSNASGILAKLRQKQPQPQFFSRLAHPERRTRSSRPHRGRMARPRRR